MIIDTHIHVWSYPALSDARNHIRSTKDLVSFRSRCPDIYDMTLNEGPVFLSCLKTVKNSQYVT